MSDDRTLRIQRLFEGALELEPSERADFLSESCAGDTELRARVEALLAADEGADTYFAELARRAGLPGAEPPAQVVDERIGPYRIVREIGRGGMGVVYLARRDDGQFEQSVALKLIRRGMDGDTARRRFLRERQILARLQHPGIARIHDGGVTDGGLPWFAMEYVDGMPIDRFCDERRLGVDARLELFREVGRAVQHAHGSLVVHRDLKPSNILVSNDGAVKLLDFGIATLLDDSTSADITQTAARVLTPAWSAPEQVRGAPVTTATDVYALGLVLYELLSGRRAHGPTDGSPGSLHREIVERVPDRPSAALADTPEASGVSPANVAEARGTHPARLRRRLAGDLDTICLTALRKEPERRYASAEALVQDIDRHLDGLPILARRDSVNYRLTKFVGRHRVGVAAAALVVAALATGMVAALWQADAAARERDAAEAVTAFMIDLFQTADPSVSGGDEVTARELLDRGAERIERRLVDQPDVQARMLTTVGQVYLQLGLHEPARPLLERALELQRERAGGGADLATTALLLGKALSDAGEADAARARLEEALRIRRARYGEEHPAVAESMFELASVLHMTADRARGDTLFERWMAMQDVLPTAPSTAQADRLLQTGQYLRGKQRMPDAERYMREALAMSRSLHGDEHPSVVGSLVALGGLLTNTQRLDEATRTYEEALRLNRGLYPDGHAGRITVLLGLSSIARRQERPAEADSLLGEALDLASQVLDPGDFQVAALRFNRGQVRHTLRRFEDAHSDFARAASIWATQLGPDHPYVMHARAGQAHALRDHGRFQEAEALYLAAEAGYRAAYGDEHALVGSTLLNRGRLYRLSGEPARAVEVLEDAKAVLEVAHGEDAVEVAEVRLALGRSLAALGRLEAARVELEAAYPVLLRERGADDEATRRAADALADLYVAAGRHTEASALRGSPGGR
ncbi:MAG: serine/threonine-protein kinase [Gemmatimonadota bacterium]|jgi:serine/threonine-protein kinase